MIEKMNLRIIISKIQHYQKKRKEEVITQKKILLINSQFFFFKKITLKDISNTRRSTTFSKKISAELRGRKGRDKNYKRDYKEITTEKG